MPYGVPLDGLVSPAFQQALHFCEDICRLAREEKIGIKQADKGVACGCQLVLPALLLLRQIN